MVRSVEVVEKKKFNEVVVYSVDDAIIAEFKEKYLSLTVKGLDDKEGYELCRKARSVVRERRLQVDLERKGFKQDALDFNKRVEVEAKRLTTPLLEVEDHLKKEQDKIDKEKKRIEEEQVRKAKEILDARVAMLQKLHADFTIDQVKAMTTVEFNSFAYDVKHKFVLEQEERKAEQERLAKLEEERVAQQKKIDAQEAENKRIRDELEEKQRKEIEEKDRVIEEERKKRAEEDREREEEAEARRFEEEEKRGAAEYKLAKEQREKDKAIADARKKIADKEIFNAITKEFPTIEKCWVEIARLYKKQPRQEDDVQGKQ